MVEQPNGDFAMTILRQFFFDAFRLPLYEALMQSPVEQLAAIAAKSVKETRYHLKHTSEWVIRMGDGTEESHQRAQAAIDHLWRYSKLETPSEQNYASDLSVRLGLCGDWLRNSTVEGAWLSGYSMARSLIETKEA